MDYTDFDDLSLPDKAQFVWDYATFIESVTYHNLKVNLYAVGRDFIEVYYTIDTNDIVRITFANNQNLKKYLSNINLVF